MLRSRDLCRDVQSDEDSTCVRNGGQPNIPMSKGEVDYRVGTSNHTGKYVTLVVVLLVMVDAYHI